MVKTGVRRVLSEHVDAYSYTGGIIGNDAEDHLEYEPAAEALAEMKLTPYKGLANESLIRYLYTGREYNIETGDYYYRYRMMEAGIGRFTSKDPVVYIMNKYNYTQNKPLEYIDAYGDFIGLFPLIFLGIKTAVTTGFVFGIVQGCFTISYNSSMIKNVLASKKLWEDNPDNMNYYYQYKRDLDITARELGKTAIEIEKQLQCQ